VGLEAQIQVTTDRPFSRSSILGCHIDQMTLQQCVDYMDTVIQNNSRCYICMMNAAKVVKLSLDQELKELICSADLVGADGVPVVWASRLLGQPLPGRVNGTDLMEELFTLAHQRGYSLYLLGARKEVISETVKKVRSTFPNIRIAGFRHGYFKKPQDEEKVIADINSVKPDILLLGMGTPMKEMFVKRHRAQLQVPVIHGVGGSFDIWGGITKRAPKWMQNNGLEWFYRFIQEPFRLWKRYLGTNSLFVWMVLKEWYRTIVLKKHQ